MPVRVDVLEGFDDRRFDRDAWEALHHRGRDATVFTSWPCQRAWWDAYPRERLLLLVARRGAVPIALAPLFAEDGMAYFVGSGGSDYLDFVGDDRSPGTLAALLAAARETIQGFRGFRFYHVPAESPTIESQQTVADHIGCRYDDEGTLPGAVLDLAGRKEAVIALTRKRSIRSAEKRLRTLGPLRVMHLRAAKDIEPQLDEFFAQHVARWAATPSPSAFLEPRHRTFFRRLTAIAAASGWLRFTRLECAERAVAFHFGFSYRGRYLFYKPTFAVDLAACSPGQVLLRDVLLDAIEEGAERFDFGLGDEPYKSRFVTCSTIVRTVALYDDRRRPS